MEALQKSVGQLSKNKLAYDGPNVNYKPSTQKPLEPTKNQIEVRKYYPGSKPENSESGSTSGNNKNSSGKGTGNNGNVKLNKNGLTPEQEKHYRQKIDEAKARGDQKAADDARY